jgi:hypothetical protein
MSKPYSVNFWGSYPGKNDDCWMGEDYETLDEAMEVFNAPVSEFSPHMDTSDVQFIEIDGPDKYQVRVNPDKRLKGKSELTDEWLEEIRREAGMLYGIQGLNDYA